MSEAGARAAIEVGLLFHQVYTAATQRLNSALQPLDLTTRHASVMFMIRDGVKTQRDLVARLSTDKTGMVRTVDDLERLGYVTRVPSSTDRRVTILNLTDDGDRALKAVQQQTSTVAGGLFTAVDTAELESLRSVLSRMLTGLAPRD